MNTVWQLLGILLVGAHDYLDRKAIERNYSRYMVKFPPRKLADTLGISRAELRTHLDTLLKHKHVHNFSVTEGWCILNKPEWMSDEDRRMGILVALDVNRNYAQLKAAGWKLEQARALRKRIWNV